MKSVRAQVKDRQERLMPGGVPRYIRCYDTGGLGDRYTVVFSRTGRSGSNGKFTQDGGHLYLGMSCSPKHPLGICQHGESIKPIDYPSYKHLGKRIKFADLPPDCKEVVMNDYRKIWNLEYPPAPPTPAPKLRKWQCRKRGHVFEAARKPAVCPKCRKIVGGVLWLTMIDEVKS